MKKADFIIAGAGIIGLTLAIEIKKKFLDSSVLLLEKEKSLAFHASGKLVVCQTMDELEILEKLYQRGTSYGIELAKISAQEAHEIDLNVITCESLLWSPTTSTVDPMEVMQALQKDALNMGIEIHKYSRANIIRDAAGMYKNTGSLRFEHWGKPGIRAQLVNIDSNSLEMDFVFEGDEQSFHVLNAVSPAFTCSMPFADYLAEQIDFKLHG